MSEYRPDGLDTMNRLAKPVLGLTEIMDAGRARPYSSPGDTQIAVLLKYTHAALKLGTHERVIPLLVSFLTALRDGRALFSEDYRASFPSACTSSFDFCHDVSSQTDDTIAISKILNQMRDSKDRIGLMYLCHRMVHAHSGPNRQLAVTISTTFATLRAELTK